MKIARVIGRGLALLGLFGFCYGLMGYCWAAFFLGGSAAAIAATVSPAALLCCSQPGPAPQKRPQSQNLKSRKNMPAWLKTDRDQPAQVHLHSQSASQPHWHTVNVRQSTLLIAIGRKPLMHQGFQESNVT